MHVFNRNVSIFSNLVSWVGKFSPFPADIYIYISERRVFENLSHFMTVHCFLRCKLNIQKQATPTLRQRREVLC